MNPPSNELIAIKNRINDLDAIRRSGKMTPGILISVRLNRELEPRAFSSAEAAHLRAIDAAVDNLQRNYRDPAFLQGAASINDDVLAATRGIFIVPESTTSHAFGTVAMRPELPQYPLLETGHKVYALRGFARAVEQQGLIGKTALFFSSPEHGFASRTRLATMSREEHKHLHGALLTLREDSSYDLTRRGSVSQLFAAHVQRDPSLTELFTQIERNMSVREVRVANLTFDVEQVKNTSSYRVRSVLAIAEGSNGTAQTAVRSPYELVNGDENFMNVAKSLASLVDTTLHNVGRRFPRINLDTTKQEATTMLNSAVRHAGRTQQFLDQHLRREPPGISL